MLTKDIRQTIDNARDVLVGKIPNPQSQIEQITTAMIYKFMDDMDLESVEFGGERQYFVKELEKYSWTKIMSSQLGNDDRMKLYKEALEKLPLSNQIPKLFRNIFKGAYLPFNDSKTLTLFLKEIDDLSYSNSENLGNGFEYLLSIMGSQGEAGMFRTPRHIIDFIVSVVKPKKTDTILDPACGTAGFLISAYKYILQDAKDNNQVLTPAELTTLTENIQGYDISPDMVKLALVNMYLHKFKNPKIYEYDTLTSLTRWEEYFDCILANPPFMTPKGGIQPHNRFGVKANKSEVLFVDYIMEHLNSTGKAGVVVPEGIVFQSANAYKQLRKKLVDEKYLYAVVSLPSGVFNPYSGVKTSILFMDKQLAKQTDKILFVEVKQDGFDLGAQRRETPDKNDLPEALDLLYKWQDSINSKTVFSTESKLVTVVEKSKLAEGEEYNLTASRYKETQDFSNCKWDMVKLGDICENITKGTTPTTNGFEFTNDGINFVKIESIDLNGNFIPEKFVHIDINCHNAFKRSQLQENDILFSIAGALGRVAIVNKEILPANTNQALSIIRLKRDMNISYKYVANILKSQYILDKIKSLKTGVAQYNLSLTQISNLEIPLPPLEMQEEIVRELDGYQAVIYGAQKVIDNWKPTLPLNPNWQKVKLNDERYFSLESGGTPSSNEPSFWNGDIKWATLVDLPQEDYITYLTDTERKITESGLAKSSAKLLPPNSILVSSRATIGRVAISEVEISTNQGFKNIVIKDFSKINIKFLALNVKSLSEKMNNLATGGTFKEISKTAIGTLEVYIPPIEEQNKIVEKIEAEEKIVEECKKLIQLHQEKINNKIKSIWGNDSE